MRLADLLADSTLEELARLAHEHAKVEEQMSRPQLLAAIESVLRSYRFLQEFLLNRQPPAFSMMVLLLEAPEFAIPTAEFRNLVLAETGRICDAMDSGALLARDEQLRVYRRALYQARSNDMQIDSSESAILGVLRQELGITQTEHCLIEHHRELREYWRQDGAFAREVLAFRSAGLLFSKDERTILPEDLAPVIRQVLGVDMPRDATRRLLQQLTGQELRDALQRVGAPSSGSKDERINRLVEHMAQPRVLLREISLETLRSICREIGAAVAGSKECLVERIVGHMVAGRDLVAEPEPPAPPVLEQRSLSESRFALLFEQLKGHQMAGILGEFDLRRWGIKEMQVKTLWESHRAEKTLLECLSNPELDAILRRIDLKVGGSKSERTDRLIEFFGSIDESAFRAAREAGTQQFAAGPNIAGA
jgi:hypothetical protein